MSKPLAIDCSQLIHASHSVMSELTYEEKHTGVVYGFFSKIFKLAHEFITNKFIFCWDSKKRWRQLDYPDYKADRDEKRKEQTWEEKENISIMFQQAATIRYKILPKLGFKNNFILTGLEADDLMAYCVEQLPGITLVTNDSDMFQLLSNCEIYRSIKNDRLSENDFIEQYNIAPKQWIDVLCISGTHNNVKGIEGAGIKKAIAYLKGTLPDGKIKKRIEEGKDIIKRNRKLIELPYVKGELDIDFDEQFGLDNWHNFFRDYGFNSFLKKDNFNQLKREFNLQ